MKPMSWLQGWYLSYNLSSHIVVRTQVLTTGCWPSYQLMDVNMPPQMEKCMQLFQQHYLKRTNHRTLKWVHRLGQATVRPVYILCLFCLVFPLIRLDHLPHPYITSHFSFLGARIFWQALVRSASDDVASRLFDEIQPRV